MSAFPARIDVAIIGGGFAGCATAWALARRGVSAIVLEREHTLGRFASGRGAGLGRQLAEDEDTTALTVRGAQVLRTELAAAWTPTGGVLGFDDPARVEAYVARAAAAGIGAQLLDRAAVLADWPALEGLSVTTGLFVPTDGVIDTKVLLSLYAAATRVELACPVTKVEAGGAGALVSTPRGEIEATMVVDATGAWAGALTNDLPLEVLKRHLYVLEVSGGPRAPFLWHLGREEMYVRTDGDGVLVSVCDASRDVPGDTLADPVGETVMRTLVGRAAPTWDDAPIKRAWACQRTFTPDRSMRLKRDVERPWLAWAVGLGGHGATASAAIGETVAAALT